MKVKVYLRAMSTECFSKLIRFVGSPIVKMSFHPLVLNEDTVYNEKPVIYAPNHRSTLDPFCIIASSKGVAHWVALKRFFDGEDSIFNNSKNPVLCKITAVLMRSIGAIPVDRGHDTQETIDRTNEYLDTGSSIGIFPEGTTNKNPEERETLPIHSGVIRFAKQNDAWIQPISVVWIPNATKGENKVIINFRPPFKVKEMSKQEALDQWERNVLEGIEENNQIINQIMETKKISNKTLQLKLK